MSVATPLRVTDDWPCCERLVREWQAACEAYKAAGQPQADATRAFLAAHPEVSERTLFRWYERIARVDDLAGLTDPQRATIEQRRRLIDAWRTMRRGYVDASKNVADADEAFLAVHPELSRRTLYRWSRARDSEDPTDLLDRRSYSLRRPPTRFYTMEDVTRLAKDGPLNADPDAWSTFKSLYLTTDNRTVAFCHSIVAFEAARHDWPWPALRTVQQWSRRYLPPIVTYYYTAGPEAWQLRYGKKIHRDYSGYRANQVWVGDGHTLDVFCRKSETDPTIVRPTLVTWLDLRSRLIVGYALVLTENQDAILLAFRRGVERYGPPAEVNVDNGKGYKATGISGGKPHRANMQLDEDYLRSVFGSLNVACHFSIRKNPNGKAAQERWYRTFEEQFCASFTGVYCGGGKDERFKYASRLARSSPQRCPTIEQFQTAFDRYLEAYHKSPHSGDGMDGLCPLDAFERFDPMPRVVVPDALLDLLLMRVADEVKVTSRGVRFMGDDYSHSKLLSLQGQTVWLKVDPDQAGYVIVTDERGAPICKAVNNKRTAGGLNLDNVKAGMKERNRTRRLVAQVARGAARIAGMDVTDAAIAARLHQAEAARKLVAATGTFDETPVRNVTILHSDLTDSVRSFNAQIDPPIDVRGLAPRSLSDCADELDDGPECADAPLSLADVDFDD